jgi:hypothetical protein
VKLELWEVAMQGCVLIIHSLTAEPAYIDMLQTSDLTRIIEALTRKPGYKDTSALRIALSYLAKI